MVQPGGDDVIEVTVEDLRSMSDEELLRLADSIVLSPDVVVESCRDRNQLICRILRSSINPF